MHLPGDGVGHGDGEQEEPEYLQGGRTEPAPAGGHPSPVQSIPGAQIALIDGYSSGTEPALAVGSLYLGHRYLI